jgi:hypothetical protein
MAEADGTAVEAIERLPDEPATEAQLSYARDPGIPIPENPTKEELQNRLSSRLGRDKPATARHKAFADLYGVEYSEFVGKRMLFEMIFSALQEPGREKELASWFAFRVYRELVHGVDSAPITGPGDPIIQEVACELASDDSVMKSIRRYRGTKLIWFGEWTGPDGIVYTGGSNRTAAYRHARDLLGRRLAAVPRPPQTCAQSNPTCDSGGRVPILVYVVVIGMIALLIFLLMRAN